MTEITLASFRSLGPPSATNEAGAQEATGDSNVGSPQLPASRGRGRDDNLIPSQTHPTNLSTPSPSLSPSRIPTSFPTHEPIPTTTNLLTPAPTHSHTSKPPLLSAQTSFPSDSSTPQRPLLLSSEGRASPDAQTSEDTSEVVPSLTSMSEHGVANDDRQNHVAESNPDALPEGWDSAYDEKMVRDSNSDDSVSIFFRQTHRCEFSNLFIRTRRDW